jgi:hypothetical protein
VARRIGRLDGYRGHESCGAKASPLGQNWQAKRCPSRIEAAATTFPEVAFRNFRGRDADTNALMRDRGFPVA